MAEKYDAVVVGSGPNGLTAAITMAHAGLSVLVVEGHELPGGGSRTAELTLPGFRHDICGAIHPIGVVSPVFKKIGLEKYGLEWVYAPVPMAHPLDDGTAALLEHGLEETGATLGSDAEAWRRLMSPFLKWGSEFFEDILRPIRIPKHPLMMARFGLVGLRSCESLVKGRFEGDHARALFTGCAAHSILPLDAFATASFGLVLALAGHAIDWPCARGGSSSIIDALIQCLTSLGGEIRTGQMVRHLDELPESRVVLFDVPPRSLSAIAGEALPSGYRGKLERFRMGPGVFKIDYALDGPIPWRAAGCHRAATVHVAGTYDEVLRSEHAMSHGEIAEKPFVLVAQQSLIDSTRAPAGKHTGWAYCHVPSGSTVDMTDAIESQIERFAPGFRDLILARHTISPAQLEHYNPNMIGGDIGGGANDIMQFIFRPFPRIDPYSTPNERLWLCSSSAPPGGGVHGMCGYLAARSALKKMGVEEGVWEV
jgi:phytoene dehydrogenase-like protein